MVLIELNLTVSNLIELTLKVSTLGGCGGPERTDFNSFYIDRVWWS